MSMEKIFGFLKKYWQFLLIVLFAFVVLWDKIKDVFSSIFYPSVRDEATNYSGSDYLGNFVPDVDKGVIIGSDGLEYFKYGNKRVRLTDGSKAMVVSYVNLLYDYLSNNTTSLYDWFLDDTLHFYNGEIQATLNDYKKWCCNRQTWIHYFAFVWLQLHSVPFLDYLRASMDAEGYEATQHYVTNLGMFYY